MNDPSSPAPQLDGAGVLEAGALTVAGTAYPFTAIPPARVRELMDAWRAGTDGERVQIIGDVLGAALGAEGLAALEARAVDPGDPLDLEALVLATGRALGASTRAAIAARS